MGGPADPAPTPARLGGPGDVAELVRLRAVMFSALGLDPAGERWRRVATGRILRGFEEGTLVAAVVDHPEDPGLVACGLAEVTRRLPGPHFPEGTVAYLSSMSTEPEWRRRGLARAVLTLLLHELDSFSPERIELHATPEGEPLYRAMGFTDRRGGVELRLVRRSGPPPV
jgi:GNAT superfamily N-acetyltransferase